MSAVLVEQEVELVNAGSVFIDFQNIIGCLRAVLSEYLQILDAIAKGSNIGGKKKLLYAT